MQLDIWDAGGQEEMRTFRQKAYFDVDVFCVCFSMDNATSLRNVNQSWIEEIKQAGIGIPRVLVGCKQDIRSPDVTDELIEKVRSEGGFSKYWACSA